MFHVNLFIDLVIEHMALGGVSPGFNPKTIPNTVATDPINWYIVTLLTACISVTETTRECEICIY